MIPGGAGIEYRRLRAPRDHGGVLIDPPLQTVPVHLSSNRASLEVQPCELHGRYLSELAVTARRELLAAAQSFTSAYRDLHLGLDENRPLLLSGHQPLLFHPGVWFKNFALAQLATRHQAWGVHLLIDNDTSGSLSVRVPTGMPDDPHAKSVALDEAADELPFEERSIRDRSCFGSFGERVAQAIGGLVPDPLVRELWPLAVRATQRRSNLGQCLSEARHLFEARWGLQTLEVPLSTVCRSPSFRWFAIHLLANLPRLSDIYNRALAEYRRVHRLRNRAHPVPDLAVKDGWHEAPFWLWTAAAPRRRPAFVRRVDGELELTDRDRVTLRLPLAGPTAGEDAVERLRAAEVNGVKLRPRALITTLYARLVLSDLFLHGIGGAKYDQVTDVLIRDFFGLAPKTFVTLTATVHLPIHHEIATDEDLRRIDHALRELRFHPERFMDESERNAVRELLEEKSLWLATTLPRGQRLARHRELVRINAALQPFVAARREEWIQSRPKVARAVDRASLLSSREFSYCLYPEKFLCTLLLELCATAP